MPVLSRDLSLVDNVRFRDDDPEMFGVKIKADGCDENYVNGLREHLCNSVELVPELFPEIARAISQVQHDILPGEEIRAFISADPTPQAWCIGANEAKTMILGITSGLIRLMTIDELKFVIGHEIGHYIMGHHSRTPPEDDGVDSINYRSLQRMAEISADRVGFLVSPRSEAAFRAMLKTATGLGDDHLRFDISAFTAQFQRLKELRKDRDKRGSGHSAYSTHPLLTVRCRALLLFEESEPYRLATGRPTHEGLSRDALDETIAGDLFDSTGYHPIAEVENAVRGHLIWLALRLFIEDGRFTKSEQAFLTDNFDGEIAERAIEFVRSHGPAAVCKKYEDALEALSSMRESARESACSVIRRVASVAGGTDATMSTLLGQIHKALAVDSDPRIEPWENEVTLGGLINLG